MSNVRDDLLTRNGMNDYNMMARSDDQEVLGTMRKGNSRMMNTKKWDGEANAATFMGLYTSCASDENAFETKARS